MVATIYVALLNEGVDAWRPVEATALGDDIYRIEGTVPSEEDWQFLPGTRVRCELKAFGSGETRMTAVAVA